VRDYVLETAVAASFLDRLRRVLADVLPAYQAEGRSYLTVAIGCTGGRHRSVAVAEEVARRLRERGMACAPPIATSPGAADAGGHRASCPTGRGRRSGSLG
jgi:2-polyprenyl-6-methoxyphenol hydroxylase-like FAD-dependent oxidoreductase